MQIVNYTMQRDALAHLFPYHWAQLTVWRIRPLGPPNGPELANWTAIGVLSVRLDLDGIGQHTPLVVVGQSYDRGLVQVHCPRVPEISIDIASHA